MHHLTVLFQPFSLSVIGMARRPRNRNRVRNLKNVAEVRHAVRKSPILGSPMKNPNLGLVISVTSATGDCNAWPF